MSDKLQEIEQSLADRKERPSLNHRHMNEWAVFSYMEWLIEQLEQAQAANQKLVEGLSWYAACEHYEANVVNQWGPEIAVLDDGGQRAYDILKEVKGNVGDS